jgi:N-methylhydantoinase A/oxoprolinase/acetone carboxylase beta subunit
VAELVAALIAEASRGLDGEPERSRVRYELRYEGQSFELAVEAGPDPAPGELAAAFAAAHRERYGFEDPAAAVQLVTVRASVWGSAPALELATRAGAGATTVAAEPHRAVFDGHRRDAELWRGEPAPGTRLTGPAVCALPEATLVIEPGWTGDVDHAGTVILKRVEP